MGKLCSKMKNHKASNHEEKNYLNKEEIRKIFEKEEFSSEITKNKVNLNESAGEYEIIKKNISKTDFKEIKTIGRGSFGKVILVQYLVDQKLYAMKVLHKDSIKAQNQIIHTKTEREILERVDHPFIVRLQFAFQTLDKLYLITDFMQGGELFYHLHTEGRFTESKTKFYAAEIVLALEYLHTFKIIYRDLKPENILLDSEGHIRITDFGLSKFMIGKNDSRAYTICGTPEYLAPEILTGRGYDKSVDWWSLGCLIYEMLCGYSPFKIKSEEKINMSIYKAAIKIPESFSDEAKDLVKKLVQVDVKKRLGYNQQNATEIKNHPFFQDIDWEAIYNRNVEVPLKPDLKGTLDLDYFDKMFTDEIMKDTPYEKNLMFGKGDSHKYEGFTYKKPDEEFKIVHE